MRSLRNRLIISHILPILVIIPLAGLALFYVLETQFLLPSVANNLAQDARYLAELSRTEFQLFGNPVIVSNLLNRVRIDPAFRVMFLNENGAILFSSDPDDTSSLGQVLQTDGLNQAQLGEQVIQTNYSILRLNNVLVDVFSPVITPQEEVIGVVRVSYRSESLFQFFARLRNLITWVLIIGLFVGTFLGSILGLNIGNPIRRVTVAIYGLAQGVREEKLPEGGPDEIQNLSRAVNHLVSRLDELEESRRHLLANLVHELGRPLGAMRSGIHAIQRGAGQDHDMLMELANGMDEESNRMQHVLEELTHLHDQVIGTLELNKEEIILAEWLPNILLPWRQVAQENQLDWEEEIASDLPKINLDPIRMAQVIGNLASNAVRYTPAGGSIKFSAVSSDKQVMFNFEDTGPGIVPDEQDLVFEPFYRGDQGKRIKQGMGLGLSIARDITHAHGGEIELWSEPGEGSKFTVWLPLI